MSADFNPYHVWLGIPPDEQPADHYRLLSLRSFEISADVIDNAADRQMAHLRTIQVGKHVELSQRLLNEVTAARICLLDPKKRAAYDQQLRAKLAATTAPAAKAPTLPVSAAASLPAATPPAGDGLNELLSDVDRKPHKAGGQSATLAKPGAARREAKQLPIPLFVAAGAVLIAAAGIGLYLFTGNAADGALTFDWPADERTGAAMTVDGVPVPIPATGPWEYSCQPGKHQIVAKRTAFKLESTATTASGEQQSIPADWKPKATLLFAWPLNERKDAALVIDGLKRFVSPSQQVEFPVEPGRHVVQITRPNSEPFELTMVVAEDEHHAVSVNLPPWPTLVLEWPVDQRKDAAISIDNEPLSIDSADARPELRLKPGRHAIHVTRPGYQQFDQVASLAAGSTTSISPVLEPLAKIRHTTTGNPVATNIPATSEKLPPSTAPPQPIAPTRRQAIPTAEEQERIAKLLSDVYKVSHSPAKDKPLVAQLFKTADESGNSPAERYMLLTKGINVAADVGDYEVAFQGIDTLANSYEVEPFEAKQRLLKESVKSLMTTNQVAGVVTAAEQLIDQTVSADQFDAGLAVVATAKEAIAKRPSDFRIFKEDDEQLTRLRREITALQKSLNAMEDARKALEKDPNDADANLTLGRWLCLLKNDWSNGLLHFAKGSDVALKALAEQEIAGNLDEKQQSQLADGWWDFAQKETDLEREGARQHAAELYRIALPKAQSPLKQAAIEQRLVDLATIQPHGGPRLPATAGGPFAHSQWVDLLRLGDPTTDAIYGTWSRKGAELICEPAEFARISFPIEINAGYDLEVEFTRKEGNDELNAIIPVAGHPCMVMLSAFDGKTSGLSRVGGVSVADQKQYAIHPGKIENDRRYRLLISVRLIKGNMASIDTFLQGKPIWPQWKGPITDLLAFAGWSLPTAKRIGLGAWNDKMLFHSVRLKVISGEAEIPSTVAALPPTVRIVSARFGGGSNWADVTQKARDTVRNGGAVWANTSFLQKDPTPGWKKQLVITIDTSGNRKDLWFNEGDGWRMDATLSK